MATNNYQELRTDEPLALDVQLNKTEEYIEKNWKKILIALAAVIVVVLGVYFYLLHRM